MRVKVVQQCMEAAKLVEQQSRLHKKIHGFWIGLLSYLAAPSINLRHHNDPSVILGELLVQEELVLPKQFLHFSHPEDARK